MTRRALMLAIVLAAAPGARAEDKPVEDTFPSPEKPSAIKVAGESEGEIKEPPTLDPELLEKLVAASRGGKSAFPDAILKAYNTDLDRATASANTDLGNGILRFCAKNMGKKVGNGQCAVLLAEAVKAVGAKRYPPSGLDADYVWGKAVATIRAGKTADASKIQPGDMLQFRDAAFKGTLNTKTGSWWWSYNAGHHSAVVMRAARGGTLISVYESNVNNVLTVQKGYYDFKDMKSGTVWVYRAAK